MTPTTFSNDPLVSIGVPVYNEERFLDASLTSLRQQDYLNLEILISDNASTDRTLEICERHATKDARIRIVRSAENRGATANFQRALELAQGSYFMWAAGHDLWTQNLVSECVALLQANDNACIAFGSSRWIGAEGELLPRESGWSDTRGMAPVARFFTIFWGNMHSVVGLIRTTRLRECLPTPDIAGGDLVLLENLALRGDFVHATQAVWSRREFRVEARYEDKLQRYASAAAGVAQTPLQKMFPLLRLPIALVRVILRSRLSGMDKLGVLLVLLISFPLRYLVGRRGQAK